MTSDLTEEDLGAIGRELLDYFPDEDHRPCHVDNRFINTLAHVPLVHAFSRHAVRLGGAFLDLSDSGLRLESVPTLRACYEHALTAAWLVESRDGVPALFNEDLRQRRALAKAMERAVSELFRENAKDITGIDTEELESNANAQARSFEQLCGQLLPGGTDAYVVYRALSAHTHPSALIADSYVEKDEHQPAGMILRLTPTDSEHRTWTSLAVSSMVWAARAMDDMKIGHPDRGFLEEKADQLGVARALTLTVEARRAQWEAERDRKKARRAETRRRKVKGAVSTPQNASDTL